MADASGFSSGNFIKADEVEKVIKSGHSFVVKITSEAVLKKKTFDDGNTSEKFECDVATKDNTERAIGFNKTSVGNLVSEWGGETKNWIGKKVSLQVVNKKIDSKDRQIIYATPVIEEEGDAVTIKQGVLK